MTRHFEVAETFSLQGKPLYKKPILLWLPSEKDAYDAKIQELEADYRKAKQDYLADPDDPEKLIWLGRKAGIIGNFMEAVSLYSHGIEKWPDNPRLFRFRGHRFALLRRIDLAIQDFEKAAALIEGMPEEVETYASGGASENKLGAAGFKWNVYYHQGFTYVVAGLFEKAVEAYRKCMEYADNMEGKVSTTHWLCIPLLRLGYKNEVEKLLETIKPNMKLVEVDDYYETLLMYKDHTTPEELLEKARSEGPVRFPTRAHAIGNLYLSEGNREQATKVFKEIVAGGVWTAGVSLIAEAELKRLRE